MKIKFFKAALTMFMAASLLVSCDSDNDTNTTPAAKDIVAVASGDTQFSTLVAAIQKADLVKTLQGAGPYTVFAPNNTGFTNAKITSLDGLSKEALTPILTGHVLGAKVLAANVQSGEVTTAGGSKFYLSKNPSGVFINGNIKVIATDVAASNGVIHVIDNVISFPDKNLVTIASNNPDFKELVDLVLAADPAIAAALTNANTNGLTVFAPNNAAFTELYKTLPKAELLKASNKGLLTSVLQYHVVAGRVFSSDLPNITGDVTALSTNKLKFNLSNGVSITSEGGGVSKVTSANIMGTNGVIHVIDKVILPKL
jgi:uncharacterized surface protein with fasciclin (FAS1) repeats